MIDKNTYEEMKSRYGDVGSWAIWGNEVNGKVTSGMNDMSWLDLPNVLDTLNTGFVFVGENWSRNPNEICEGPWRNFHTGHRNSKSYKLRNALRNTRYWGSYITDVFKNNVVVDSHEAEAGKTRAEKDAAVAALEEEIEMLGGKKPVIVALGEATYKILNTRLGGKYTVVRVMHYSHRVSAEKYKDEVLKVLDTIQ